MMNRRPPREDGQRRFRPLVLRAAANVNGDPLDARQAWLASFWALVLWRFREYAHGAGEQETPRTGEPPGGARCEEDR